VYLNKILKSPPEILRCLFQLHKKAKFRISECLKVNSKAFSETVDFGFLKVYSVVFDFVNIENICLKLNAALLSFFKLKILKFLFSKSTFSFYLLTLFSRLFTHVFENNLGVAIISGLCGFFETEVSPKDRLLNIISINILKAHNFLICRFWSVFIIQIQRLL